MLTAFSVSWYCSIWKMLRTGQASGKSLGCDLLILQRRDCCLVVGCIHDDLDLEFGTRQIGFAAGSGGGVAFGNPRVPDLV